MRRAFVVEREGEGGVPGGVGVAGGEDEGEDMAGFKLFEVLSVCRGVGAQRWEVIERG
jgi:hypothetical protein